MNCRFCMPAACYETDLTDEKWSFIKTWLPKAKPGGRPRTTNLRRVVDAILYFVKTGCQWRNLPHDFPCWQTVYTYFRAWQKTNVVKRLTKTLMFEVRVNEGKRLYPSIAMLDSQSVKTGKLASKDKGYDGGKRVKGRKRHIAVDSLGLPLAVVVTAANTHDKNGGKEVITDLSKLFSEPSIKKVYADGGYMGEPFKALVKQTLNAKLDISKGVGQKAKRFVPIRKRWVVERSFAWLGDYRRLDKDHERLVKNSAVMIRWAFINLMLNRLCSTQTAWA